jgi:hypothetical protein
MMPGGPVIRANWLFFAAFEGFYLALNAALMAGMAWSFRIRWRMA